MSIWLSTVIAVVSAAQSPEVETFEYTIKKGDSCAKIAKSVYGDRKHYELVHQYNRWLGPKLPHRLEEGQVLVLPKTLPPALPDAEVTAARRTVEARSPETPSWSTARPGLDLFRGWRVNTHERSSAEITFRDHSRIDLRQNTLVIIYGGSGERTRRKTSEATLDRGALRTRLGAYTGKSGRAVTVTTPSAVTEIDGGMSLVTVDPEGTSRVANHGAGKASVRSSKGGTKVKVKSKMGSKVVKDKRPSKPKALPPTPAWTTDGATTFASAGDRGAIFGVWIPVDTAEAYRVEIARQPDGADLIASRAVPSSIHRFEVQDLPPGDYYVSVAAIDDDKFESPPSDRQKLSLVGVPLLTPGAAPLPEADEEAADADQAAPKKVLRGTRLDVPRGLRCQVDGGELSRQPVLSDTGEHEVTCVDEREIEVPGFSVTVVEVKIAAQAEAQGAVRGTTTTASFSLDADVPLPRRLWVEAPEGFLVGAPAPNEDSTQWSVRVHADEDTPDQATLRVMADAGGLPVELGQVPLTVNDAAPTSKDPLVTADPEPPRRERHMIELGLNGGIMLPSENHDLIQESFSDLMLVHEPLNRAAPSFGLRIGYYPIRWVGVELENGVVPTRTRNTDEAVTLFYVRGQVVGQLPGRITPTLHIGAGELGIEGHQALGRDIDLAVHFGGGVKFYATRWVAIRLDVRDVVTSPEGQKATHSPEILLGISGVFGRRSAK